MEDHQYDYRFLLELYLRVKRDDYPHEDFRNYDKALLAMLEQIFEVDFSSSPVSPQYLWRVFGEMVASYLSLRVPLQGYLEVGGIFERIKRLGPQGEKIFQLMDEVTSLTWASREKHLQLLYELFEGIYGKRSFVVTAQDLKAKGFDDAKKPLTTDPKYYYDMLS